MQARTILGRFGGMVHGGHWGGPAEIDIDTGANVVWLTIKPKGLPEIELFLEPCAAGSLEQAIHEAAGEAHRADLAIMAKLAQLEHTEAQ